MDRCFLYEFSEEKLPNRKATSRVQMDRTLVPPPFFRGKEQSEIVFSHSPVTWIGLDWSPLGGAIW